MILKSKAKINLFLHITGKLPNNYHSLESIFYFPDIYDEIEILDSDEFSIEHDGEFVSYLPQSIEGNIIHKAYKLLEQKYPDKVKPIKIKLTKSLPVASGIGGGSGNAACIINAINQKFELGLSDVELIEVAANIGADVPASIISDTLFVSGFGEKLERLNKFPKLNILLVNTLKPISTEYIFKKGFKEFSNPIKIPEFSDVKELVEFLNNTKNDLYPSALELLPELAGLISDINSCEGCLLSRMSGSGATCFGIFDIIENLKKAKEIMAQKHLDYWVKSSPI